MGLARRGIMLVKLSRNAWIFSDSNVSNCTRFELASALFGF
jgi:hypothetical protein